jgi:Sulfotransferase domain
VRAGDVGPQWPNLFVVGVARAGTSSIAAYLGQHPDIFMSPLKEPYFFSDHFMEHQVFPKDDAAYLALFEESNDARWRAEASTSYFWDPRTPERIASRCANAHIVVSLRDPVARAYSGYWHAVQLGGETRSFSVAIRDELRSERRGPESGTVPGYVDAGWYLDNLKRWAEAAGPRLHVLVFEDFARDPRTEMHRLFGFLGVDTDAADRINPQVRNASVAPRNAVARRLWRSRTARSLARQIVPARSLARAEGLLRSDRVPEMPTGTKRMLEDLYEPERAPLEEFIGRPLPW